MRLKIYISDWWSSKAYPGEVAMEAFHKDRVNPGSHGSLEGTGLNIYQYCGPMFFVLPYDHIPQIYLDMTYLLRPGLKKSLYFHEYGVGSNSSPTMNAATQYLVASAKPCTMHRGLLR